MVFMTMSRNHVNTVVRMVPTMAVTIRVICRSMRNNVDKLYFVVFVCITVLELPYDVFPGLRGCLPVQDEFMLLVGLGAGLFLNLSKADCNNLLSA